MNNNTQEQWINPNFSYSKILIMKLQKQRIMKLLNKITQKNTQNIRYNLTNLKKDNIHYETIVEKEMDYIMPALQRLRDNGILCERQYYNITLSIREMISKIPSLSQIDYIHKELNELNENKNELLKITKNGVNKMNELQEIFKDLVKENINLEQSIINVLNEESLGTLIKENSVIKEKVAIVLRQVTKTQEILQNNVTLLERKQVSHIMKLRNYFHTHSIASLLHNIGYATDGGFPLETENDVRSIPETDLRQNIRTELTEPYKLLEKGALWDNAINDIINLGYMNGNPNQQLHLQQMQELEEEKEGNVFTYIPESSVPPLVDDISSDESVNEEIIPTPTATNYPPSQELSIINNNNSLNNKNNINKPNSPRMVSPPIIQSAKSVELSSNSSNTNESECENVITHHKHNRIINQEIDQSSIEQISLNKNIKHIKNTFNTKNKHKHIIHIINEEGNEAPLATFPVENSPSNTGEFCQEILSKFKSITNKPENVPYQIIPNLEPIPSKINKLQSKLIHNTIKNRNVLNNTKEIENTFKNVNSNIPLHLYPQHKTYPSVPLCKGTSCENPRCKRVGCQPSFLRKKRGLKFEKSVPFKKFRPNQRRVLKKPGKHCGRTRKVLNKSNTIPTTKSSNGNNHFHFNFTN